MRDAGGATSKDPHYVGHRRRLRARFERKGLEGFADYEVVELLLTLAIPRSDVKHSAKELIARFGTLRGILAFCPRARAYFDNDEVRLIVGCLAVIFGYHGEGRGVLNGA